MSSPSSEARLGSLARPVPLEGIAAVDDWPTAQSHLNFVAVLPGAGSSWRVAGATVRGESSRHHSTLRLYLEDDAGRRVRVKQFHNDWWIPTIADISFRTRGRPLVVGDAVAFLGRDYKRHDASCGHRWGTNVEFSLEAGAMDDADWTRLWASLDAAVPPAVQDARRSTFARRSYWNRWGRTQAPWDTTEISSLQWSDPTTDAIDRTSWAITPDRWAAVPGAINAIGWREGPQGDEMQAVFWRPMDLNVSAWLRVLRHPPPDWRPLIDASEVNRPSWTRVRIGDVDVERATMDPEVGNWMYAWREGERAYELHMRAARLFVQPQADLFVAGILRGRPGGA